MSVTTVESNPCGVSSGGSGVAPVSETGVREDRVRRAKRLIELGLLDTDERMSKAIDGLLSDLKQQM